MGSCSNSAEDYEMEKAKQAERDKFIKLGYSPIDLNCMNNLHADICKERARNNVKPTNSTK